MSTTPIPLSKLQLSPSNVRHPADGDPANDVHDLQASILVHGLMNPLLVHALKKPRGHYGVYAGGRRLRALQGLVNDGRIDADMLIDCYVSAEAPADLTEASLAENLVRVALKPGAEFEAFATLAAQGMDDAEIAARYAVDVRHVQQRRRLGRLHPDIMAALNAGPPFTLDLAKAYASTEDQALQKRVFDELSAGYQHYAHNVRNAIRGGSAGVDSDRMLKVVGIPAYLAAGGELEEDFFTDHQRVVHRGTLEELYYVKVAEQQAALAATLPESVTIVTSGTSVGAYVHATSKLEDAQRDRLAAIDARTEEIHALLEGAAEWNDAEDKPIATNPSRQAEVDDLVAEIDALETESEAIHEAAPVELPAGDVVALAVPGPGGMTVQGYYRPAGYREPAAPAAADGSGAAIDPVVSAKAGTGLTNNGVEVMRSHRRAILRGALVTDNADVGHRFLIFTLARLALNNRAARGSRGYHHDYPSSLGIAGGLASTGDPVGSNELLEQMGAKSFEQSIELFLGRPWMTEKDASVAFGAFVQAGDDEVEQVAAMLGAFVLDRSLQVEGSRNGLHDALARAMQIDDAMVRRRFWSPTAAEFDWMTNTAKLACVAEISSRAAKQIGKLPGTDISAACARFFRADAMDVQEFAMVDAEARYARMWVPGFLCFSQGDPPWIVARGAKRALEAVS